ncbi:hypothetical protein [Oceanospirillum sediminis]|uniref:Bacterial virulence factor lipase N-terminal domain-containing protein n=1 Tax=Oceanospirillum sediminis TaxID=2760088 RepID=A0A839IWV0_9GAMM|nr:hypothetical protein [Oceanospirillum sediminis]MBB1489170.1 hypothetical protein [Oceanospirillum sediminis]
MKKSLLASVIAGSIVLSGCNSSDSAIDSDNIDPSASPDPGSIPVSSVSFDPTNGNISTPTDLLMNPATGLLSVPASGDIYDSLNSQDGWGIGSPINIAVDYPGRQYGTFSLDEGSLDDSDAIILFDLTASELLEYGVDYTLSSGSSGLTITPLKAFKPANQYLLAVTDQVHDSLGRPLTPSTMYSLLSDSSTDVSLLTSDAAQQAQLAGIQALLTGINPVLNSFVPADSSIVYSTRFTTLSAEPVMQAVMDQIVSSQPQIGSVTGIGTVLSALGMNLADNKLSSFLTATGRDALTVASATAAHDPLVYYAGMQLPYFLETPTAFNCGVQLAGTGTCDALSSYWQADDGGALRAGHYAPEKRSDHTVQVLITVPDENNLPAGVSKPENGWPVVLYVHGVTSYKETVMSIAGNLAAQGVAVVAIDQPLHGSRSIDMDGDGVYELTTTSPENGSAYSKGTSLVYANLGSLRTVRDNLRQSAADVLSLRAALSNTTVYTSLSQTPVTEVDLDGESVSMLGVSLGSMVGTSALGMSDSYDADGDGLTEADADNPFDFNAAVLTVGGAQSAAVMGYSNEFGPIVKASFKQNDGFAAAVAENLGYTPEGFIALRTSDPLTYDSLANVAYPAFLKGFVSGALQVIDSGDSLLWAGKVAADTPVLVTQVTGNGVNLADQTVPNSLSSEGFPLAGTSGLINTLGLSQVSGSVASATALKAYTNFLVGKHSSLLDPSPEEGVTQDAASALAATVEMQTQAVSFIATRGRAISVSNNNVVE